MTTNVPQLTRADIQGKLEELLGAKRRHYLFALHGTGDPDVLRIDGAPAEMPVIPVRSELDLRRRLVELGDGTCATFLVPWEGSLPMDLQGRFARDGYVFRVGRETRILALFGAVEIEPEVRASPLVSYLLQYETERFPGGGRFTIDRLWPDRAIERSPTPYTEVECLSAWYAAEGGYVDWARRWTRGGGSGGLFRGIGAVLAAVDRERAELDRTFAAGLPHYLEARRPADLCIPIDQAIERIAGRFLKERSERRLLVLLMDGMAWAQAVEILAGLGNESSAWGPVAWHGIRKNRIGDSAYPPVLANFPTLTEISRSALFAGKPMQVGKTHRSDDDPDRWKANKIAVAYSDPGAGPRLLLRGEGQTKDGAATSEALSLVEDKRRRIVAVVINAIDSSLKADSAQRMKWTADAIKSLRDLLDKAREVGRTVLLCADHGHVPADRLEPAGHAKKDGARWRTWEKPEDPRAEFEVGLPASAEGVWAPAGAHGVILLTDDGRKYGGGASAGEHGGASLAEVVAPCLLIGCEDHPDVDADPELGVRPATAPGWWNFDLGVALPAATASTPEPKSRRPKPPVSNQLVMPIAPVAPPPPAKAPDESTPSMFARSKVLEARVPAARRAQVISAVDFLLSRHGIADASAFAAAMETFPLRVGGLVSLLAELLNIDGYEVLTYDKQTRQVRLDRGKLFEQFEVNE